MKIKVIRNRFPHHPIKGDILDGGKASGYIFEKMIEIEKRYFLILYNSEKGFQRIVHYNPKEYKISHFLKGFSNETQREYYLTWD